MPTGRQGNLIVTSTKTVSDAELRQMLIAEAKKQGKAYGLYFEDISSGFAVTTRRSPQAFQVIPLVVYRVYVDGRPDELVRGVSIVGTPQAALRGIVATDDKQEVFNGICGAESGSIPVSAVAPAMLVSEIETQKQAQGTARPPILPPPGADDRRRCGWKGWPMKIFVLDRGYINICLLAAASCLRLFSTTFSFAQTQSNDPAAEGDAGGARPREGAAGAAGNAAALLHRVPAGRSEQLRGRRQLRRADPRGGEPSARGARDRPHRRLRERTAAAAAAMARSRLRPATTIPRRCATRSGSRPTRRTRTRCAPMPPSRPR